MEDLINGLIQVINDWAPVLYVLATLGIGGFLRLRDITLKKKQELDLENIARNKRNYDMWEHEESQRVIRKIKALCNYYKDKGHMDSVSYVQLENGTTATSKLCNMFVSCLAEDNRFGNIPKYISRFQRIPYSKVSYWADIIETIGYNSEDQIIVTPDSSTLGADASICELLHDNAVNSSLLAPIYDPDGVLLGAALFLYSKKNFNGMKEKEQQTLMKEFKVSLEAAFLEYHMLRKEKLKEYHLPGGDS